MSKFDRYIFISIAIGIWALAMTQVFKPQILEAVSANRGAKQISSVSGSECPNGMKGFVTDDNGGSVQTNICYWQLVVSIEDMKKYPDYFN